MAQPSLSPQVFAILAALIEERAGLHYTLKDLDLVRDKVGTRALDAGFESFLDYYYYLRYDAGSGPELDRLIEALVVGETYFFREFDQLRVLARELVPQRLAKKERVRIWSAACATGEEPLTLAMLLQDAKVLDRVDLVATDINQRSLERARAGRYGRRSVRAVPEPRLAERFLRPVGEEFYVDPALIAAVDFKPLNLVDAAQVKAQGTFDFILCRNVLIYFRDEVARSVIDALSGALAPDGMLFVSVSESLMRFGTSLQCEEHGGVFVYRKAAR